MNGPDVTVEFDDLAALKAELDKLLAGAAFAKGSFGLEEGADCTAVLVHPETGDRLRFPAVVVWKSEAGVGVVFSVDDVQSIHQFAAGNDELLTLMPEATPPQVEVEGGHSRVAVRMPRDTRPPARETRPPPRETRPPRREPRPLARETTPPGDVNARVRNLPVSEQMQLARRGDQMERAALERAYGKTVWEALLKNPKITHPEVARIARKGALPRTLLDLIAETPAWLASPQVRRAVLSNRKLSRDMVAKVLRVTPRSELKLMPKQMAYPPTVREAAQKLLSKSD